MVRTNNHVIWGLLLVALGALLLLQSLGIIGFMADIIRAGLLCAGGTAFVLAFLRNRANWWTVIPGFFLLSAGGLALINTMFPLVARTWGGSLILGGFGFSFVAVYLANRKNWWALIPGGILLTLAVVAGIPHTVFRFTSGGLFFLELALTFAVLFFIPTPKGRMKWPLIPTAVLFLLGIATMTALTSIMIYIWPIVLILIGLYLALPALRSKSPAN